MKIPFYKYIVNQVFTNKNIQHICEDLKKKHYFVTTDEVDEVFKEILESSSPAIRECLVNRQLLDLEDQAHIDILKYYGIYELYAYQFLKDQKLDESPKFFKWFDDIEWIMKYEDVMNVINIFLFNGEPIQDISSVIQFKYKKKIGVDALELYKDIFWDTTVMSAKEALYYCVPLRNSSYVVRRFGDGEVEVEHESSVFPERDNGNTQPVYMMESNYIKWKLGYKEKLEVPSVTDFLKQVQMDSMFKYQEALYMEKSHEVDREEGVGFEGGEVNITRTKRKNVESERMRLMRGYVDLFLKVEDKMPEDNADDENFFKNLEQINMTFVNEEKIININDAPDILNDIKGDMQ